MKIGRLTIFFLTIQIIFSENPIVQAEGEKNKPSNDGLGRMLCIFQKLDDPL